MKIVSKVKGTGKFHSDFLWIILFNNQIRLETVINEFEFNFSMNEYLTKEFYIHVFYYLYSL